MVPSSQTKQSLSTSGSTAIPKCAWCFFTSLLNCLRFCGNGSGLCANRPFTSSFKTTISFMPSAFNKAGTATAPVLFIASTTILNFFFFIAPTSTNVYCTIDSICLSSAAASVVILPSLSTVEKLKFSFSAIDNNSLPFSSLKNSPLLFSNFNAFHSAGLWLAVTIIPPSAL